MTWFELFSVALAASTPFQLKQCSSFSFNHDIIHNPFQPHPLVKKYFSIKCPCGGTTSHSNHRRQFIKHSLLFFPSAQQILKNHDAAAIAADPTKYSTAVLSESIRKQASNLPGYGQPDIYYPPNFRGRWKVTREIVTLAEHSDWVMPFSLEYDVRFVLPSSSDDDDDDDDDPKRTKSVVSDRGYNEASYYNALHHYALDQQSASSSPPSPPPMVRSYEWDRSNPNLLNILFANGSNIETRVTKRAFDVDLEQGTLSSSEFRRITRVDTNDVRAIPSISGSRILNKWRKTEKEDVIEGIEIVYSDGGGGVMGDPMAAGAGGVGISGLASGPVISSKCRIRMERI